MFALRRISGLNFLKVAWIAFVYKSILVLLLALGGVDTDFFPVYANIITTKAPPLEKIVNKKVEDGGFLTITETCQKCSIEPQPYFELDTFREIYQSVTHHAVDEIVNDCNSLCDPDIYYADFVCGKCILAENPERELPSQLEDNNNMFEGKSTSFIKKKYEVEDYPVFQAVKWEDADATFQLLNGTLKNLKHLSKDAAVENLWAMDKIKLSRSSQTAMWSVIKGNRSTRYIKAPGLRSLQELIFKIPEKDMYGLNMSDWEVVRYLGTIEGFTRRQLGILAYSLMNEWGDDLLSSPTVVSSINGLLCGFPPYALAKISPRTFLLMNCTIFEHITGCTPRQMRILLGVAQSPEVFGPLSLWSQHNVKNAGLLMTQLTIEELRSLHPIGIRGFQSYVVEQMTKPQLLGLRYTQINSMNADALAAYRRKTGVTNGAHNVPNNSGTSLIFTALNIALGN